MPTKKKQTPEVPADELNLEATEPAEATEPIDAPGPISPDSDEAEKAAEAEAESVPEEDAPIQADEPAAVPTADAPAEDDDKPARRGRKKAAADDEAPSTARELDRIRREANIERARSEQERAERLGENQQFYAGISAMQEAQRRKRILKGTVVSTERFGRQLTVGLMVNDAFKVIVPFEEFFRDNPIDMSTVDLSSKEGNDIYIRRQLQMAEKMYGAEIDFVVTNVEFKNRDDYAILGSRKQALELLEVRNFIGTKGRKPYFNVGETRPAQIISVGQFSLYVTLGGVDVNLPLRYVTYRYTTNLEDYYHVGDTLNVVIRSITPRKDGHIDLEIDAKSAELLDAHRRQELGLIKEGSTTIGTITGIRQSKKKPNSIVIHAYLDYFRMPAILGALDPSTLSVQLRAGDKVRMDVVGFHESGFVLARVKGVHNGIGHLLR